MGLDIYKFKVLPKDTKKAETWDIPEEDLQNDSSANKLYNLYKEHFYEHMEEFIDYVSTANKLGLTINYLVDFADGCLFVMTDEGEIKIPDEECVIQKQKLYKLNIEEVQYQRKGMEPGYSAVFKNDEYMIFDAETLLHLKKYAGYYYDEEVPEKTPIHNWELNENEFIYFGW